MNRKRRKKKCINFQSVFGNSQKTQKKNEITLTKVTRSEKSHFQIGF